MNEIVLSAEQASIVASAEGSIAVRRPDGELIGWVEPLALQTPQQSPFTEEEVAAAATEALGPNEWHTTKQVLERLRSLDQSQP